MSRQVEHGAIRGSRGRTVRNNQTAQQRPEEGPLKK